MHLQRLTQPSCTCMTQARWKPQVRLSSLVHTDCPLSSSSPNWLAKAAQELLAVTGPIYVTSLEVALMQVVQRFVILYDRTSTCTDIDKARRKLFAKKTNVKLIPPKARHSITTGEGVKHRKCLCHFWAEPQWIFCGLPSIGNVCQFQMLARVHTLGPGFLHACCRNPVSTSVSTVLISMFR